MSSALRRTGNLTYRELPPEDLHRLNQYEPFKSQGLPAEVVQGVARCYVAEDEAGEIQAFWFTFVALHVEPLWVAPAYRNRFVVGRLWDGVVKMLRDIGAPIAYATIDDDADHLAAALRLGFERLGTLYGISPWGDKKEKKV